MITAVDTNVLVDVFRRDPSHFTASAQALRKCMEEGRLGASEVVWAELAVLFESEESLRENMAILGVEFLPMTRESATLAGRSWRRYREQGGSRERVIADFLVAAHARVQCDRLLTRDRGFYRSYFQGLRILDPTGGEEPHAKGSTGREETKRAPRTRGGRRGS